MSKEYDRRRERERKNREEKQRGKEVETDKQANKVIDRQQLCKNLGRV